MLIFGNGEFAKVMRAYTGYRLTVHKRFIVSDEIPFENAVPTDIIIAVGIKHRKAIHDACVRISFTPISFIHEKAYIRGQVGRGSIIFELNNVQPFATIGENSVLWAGNHIGHHSRIGSHCFITSHVCIGGGATIGDSCFIGMNATVFDHVTIGNDCVIAAGAVVDRDIPAGHTLSRKGVLVANAA